MRSRPRLRLSYAPRQVDEIPQQLPDELFRRLVRQVALRVEVLRGVGDHHLRLVDWGDVQEDEYLSQAVLRPRRADGASLGAMIAAGFPSSALSP